MKITISKSQWLEAGRRAGWMTKTAMGKQAGEDWRVTDAVADVTDKLVDEIKARGGYAHKTEPGTIDASEFPVDETHLIPLTIQIYEGSHDKGMAVVLARFVSNGRRFSLPIDRQPIDAAAIADAVKNAFMELVAMGQK